MSDDEECKCDDPTSTASGWCNNCGGRLSSDAYWAGIAELDCTVQNADGEILRKFVRNARYGNELKENIDHMLTKAEIEVIAHALTSMDARSDATDKLLDSIREKLGIENPYAEKPGDPCNGDSQAQSSRRPGRT